MKNIHPVYNIKVCHSNQQFNTHRPDRICRCLTPNPLNTHRPDRIYRCLTPNPLILTDQTEYVTL